ncbi:MAG: class I SAM-dependent rRNA methyltransferase [Bacteroidetes bacterium]|nr:MAG: class I SAM-dependent rRNA methyltransferase [Bacteroidota bacterium]REJ99871.1 MAG: class I SAM-dependent rRNA methyltransferase [Bacteroidota bacterium]REK34244.1 MAG: class I SAM-dependent rRNA methyltransferase [Bacteroidota bacterium]REK50574.1 MAG: class I SAM-dependent rRNA methyltransferase [Bacteroidota bacterium]
MKEISKLYLKAGKEKSIQHFHPWIFSGAVQHEAPGIEEGELVEVYSSGKEFLGTGTYHKGSIKVRILSFKKTECGPVFWEEKLTNAFELRKHLGLSGKSDTTMFRLVHGEGDGLPGLIIDIYNDCAVIQAHTRGIENFIPEICEALKKISGLAIQTVYHKFTDSVNKETETSGRFLYGSTVETVSLENGIKFYINWEEGQKTGFFLDQRENRKLLGSYAPGKKVLNTFSYSGGFSMYACKSGASIVHSVDSSLKAANWAGKNAELNSFNNHEFFTSDVFDHFGSSEEQYDIIILDPPAFAKHLSAAERAAKGYRNLNTEGFRRVKKGGMLFTFSCSQVIDKLLFRKIVFQAAAQSRRKVRILHQLSQGPDHPVNIYHPEGEYLKGIVLYVE